MAKIYNDKNGKVLKRSSKADTIENHGSDVSINAGAGNDSIENGGYAFNVTVNGGKGNDYLKDWGAGTVYVYNGGNDTLDNFQHSPTLVLGNFTIIDSIKSGGDVILNMSNGGSILLTSYFRDEINTVSAVTEVKPIKFRENWDNNKVINAKSGNNAVYNNSNSTTINTGSGNDVIINGDNYLDAEDSRGHNVKIRTGSGNDFIRNNHGKNVKIDAGDGADLIYVAVTSDVTVNMGAGNDVIWNDADNISINGGDGDDFVGTSSGNYHSSDNITVVGGKGNDTVQNYGGKNISINGGEGNDIIDNGFGYGEFEGQVPENAYIDAGAGNDTIVNSGDNSTIIGGDGKDSISNGGNNAKIISGAGNDYAINWGFNATINGGKGNDTIDNYEAGMVYVYKSGDGNDVIYGFGVLETLVIDGAEYSTVKSGSDVLVKVGKNTITLAGAAGLANVNIATSTNDIVPVNVVENNKTKKTIKGKSSSNWIRNYANNVTIAGGASTDDIYNSGANVVIKGGGGYDQIRSYNDNVSILGGAKADNIVAYGSNNTVNAGKGNDTIHAENNVQFVYANGDGNDEIRGFNETSTLSILGGYYSTKTSGNDFIVTVGKGKITLIDAANLSKLNIKGDKGLTVTNKTKLPVTIAADVKVVDASTRTTAVKITGNKLANSIVGGSGNDSIFGGKGNDSLWGSAGNDSLYGDAGNDTFIYKPNEGTDTIFDYQSGDMLKILTSNGKEGGTFTSSSFKSGNLTLAIDGGGKVIFDNVSSSDKFNINGTTYKISGSKLK